MRFPEKEATVIRSFSCTWLVVLLVVAAAVLGPVGAAYGQTSAGSQYNGNLGGTVHGGGGTPGASATLPFTGLDLGGLAGVGVVLIASGALLRRRTTHAGS